VDHATYERRTEAAALTTFLESGTTPGHVRSLVAESWVRSAAAGVDADADSMPVPYGSRDVSAYRAEHRLARVFPLLYDVLGRVAEDCECVMAIGDASGQLLWVCGQPGVLRRVESIHFVEGAMWDEGHAGTNAPGTALRLDQAVQIRAAEHFVRPVRLWSCTAAPIHEPETGAILGIVDVTGGEDVASPQTLGMVRAAARMAEAELARITAVEDRPRGLSTFGAVPGWVSSRPSAAVLRIRALGRLDAEVRLPGQALRLSPRHSEIITVLADEPAGLTGEQLAIEVYPDDNAAPTSTMRAELTRLRSLLGAHVLDSRPYRLIVDVESDVQDVRSLLAAGRVRDAARSYVGPLLPQSDAPGVVERRDRLQAELRAAVLAAGLPELMVAWTRSRWGADDISMWRRQAVALPRSSPLRALAAAEADRLESSLGAVARQR
jgi:hypothetical protein